MRLHLRDYRRGDGAKIDMDEPAPEWMADRMPARGCFAATATDPLGVPVACLFIHRRKDDGEMRVCARADRRLGPGSWAELVRIVRDILTVYDHVTLVCHAASAVHGRLFGLCGFVPEDPAAPHPKRYRREAA